MGKKVMLIVFWAKFGVVHWELIPRGTGLTGEVYRTILDRVQIALDGFTARGLRYGQVIFQQDNAPPHRANATRAHITETLGWELLVHPPYSPDIAPSDYHLFRSMKNHLRDVRFQNDAQLSNWVANFLDAKSTTTFYQRGIQKLPSKWQEVIDNNGHYIVS
uniref:Transposase n=1 Tax=Meloidogyne incognita TaxID=6306 RepID=A0A914LTV2_MELIC